MLRACLLHINISGDECWINPYPKVSTTTYLFILSENFLLVPSPFNASLPFPPLLFLLSSSLSWQIMRQTTGGPSPFIIFLHPYTPLTLSLYHSMLVHPPLCQHATYSTAQLRSLLLLFSLFRSRSLSFIASSRPPPDCIALSFLVVLYFSSPHLLTSFQILINNQSSVDSVFHSPNPLRAPPPSTIPQVTLRSTMSSINIFHLSLTSCLALIHK